MRSWLAWRRRLIACLVRGDTRRPRGGGAGDLCVAARGHATGTTWSAATRWLRQIAAVTGGEFRAGTLGTPTIRPARQVRVGQPAHRSRSGRTRCCCFWRWRCWPPSGCSVVLAGAWVGQNGLRSARQLKRTSLPIARAWSAFKRHFSFTESHLQNGLIEGSSV